jgi:hypothetical protein
MQGVPTHAEVPHPHLPSRTPVVAAIAALLVGGAIATGVWWLTDNDVNILPQPEPAATKVIVSQPVEPGAGTAVKDEAAVAAAISGTSRVDVNPSTGYPAYPLPSSGYPSYPSPSPDSSQRGSGGRTD